MTKARKQFYKRQHNTFKQEQRFRNMINSTTDMFIEDKPKKKKEKEKKEK